MAAQPRILVLVHSSAAADAAADALRGLPVDLHIAAALTAADVRDALGNDEWQAVVCPPDIGADQFAAIRANLDSRQGGPVLALVDPDTWPEAVRIPADGCVMWRDAAQLRSALTHLLAATTIGETRLQVGLLRAHEMDAIEALARGIAHDFNNALTAIFGYTDLAKSALPAKHDAARALGLVEQAARQAQGVAKSLLAFTRQGSAAKEPLDLTLAVTEALKLARHVLAGNIKLVTDIPTEAKIWVQASAVQLQQMVMNLALNAREAMPQGGCFSVSLRKQDAPDERGWALLCFQDEGPGMATDVMRRAAEPFFTTKPRNHHSGMGLSVTQGMVAEHGGALDITSQPGKGTTVTVKLPLCPVPQRQDAKAPLRGAGELVLIVENDDQVRSIIVSALRSAGYETVDAANGAGAREHIAAYGNNIELVIVDLDLPEQAQRDGLACLRSLVPGCVVIAAAPSGAMIADLDPRCEVLEKPFRMTDLVACVTRKLAVGKTAEEY